MAKKCKTTSGYKSNINNSLPETPTPTRPVLRLKNRGGAPKGNRNAWKTGSHSREMRELRAQVRATRVRIRVLVAQAALQIASR